MTTVRVPYSQSQWNALVDSSLYGLPYGVECGEDEHIRKWLDTNGYRNRKVKSFVLDDVKEEHVVTLEDE
jgi:hypothetical protein